MISIPLSSLYSSLLPLNSDSISSSVNLSTPKSACIARVHFAISDALVQVDLCMYALEHPTLNCSLTPSRPGRGQKGVLRKKLRAAGTYAQWKEAALQLDEYLGFDEWKSVDEDSYYDWKLVRKVKRSLSSLRANKDARGVLGVLETCMRSNFAGVESPRLYSEVGPFDL